MLEQAHLPKAAASPDLETLDAQDGCRLAEMADECGRWLQAFSDYRESLVTPAAKTIWAALVQGEFDLVTSTYERVLREIETRAASSGD